MLYDDRKIGRISVRLQLVRALRDIFARPRVADGDLMALSPHLKRDLGLDEGVTGFMPGRIERK